MRAQARGIKKLASACLIKGHRHTASPIHKAPVHKPGCLFTRLSPIKPARGRLDDSTCRTCTYRATGCESTRRKQKLAGAIKGAIHHASSDSTHGCLLHRPGPGRPVRRVLQAYPCYAGHQSRRRTAPCDPHLRRQPAGVVDVRIGTRSAKYMSAFNVTHALHTAHSMLAST
jgi:hypothetical protein